MSTRNEDVAADDDAGMMMTPLLEADAEAPSATAPSLDPQPDDEQDIQETRSLCSAFWNCCLFRRIGQSLAMASTTPCYMGLLIPLACLANHVLFYYGQTQNMWKLIYDVDVDVWYNATGLEAKTAFYSLGLERETHLQVSQHETVREFTYSYAIQELWKADGMPSTTIPRVAAVLLILVSGVWPHLKLLLLSLTYTCSNDAKRRHKILQWLSTLGKWSLADVLVVCVMVGVLNLNWTMDPTAIKNGFVYQVPLLIDILQHLYSVDQVCSYLLHVDCSSPPSTWTHAKCSSCRNFVALEFDHPKTTRTSFAGIAKGVQESGTGQARLRVEGMTGIYYFCVAVVLSILLSLMVDVLDARAERRARVLAAERNMQQYSRLALTEETGESLTTAPRREFVQAADDSMYDMLRPSGTLSTDNACVRYGLILWASVACLAVCLGAFVGTLERRVTGAIPQLMHDILGVAWDRQFSLKSLVGLTGAAGGWDWLLMATFALFVVVGPILRALMCVVALVMSTESSQFMLLLHTAIDYIGCFCAWEVVALASFLVSLIMPVATSTIIMRPECSKVDSSGSCLEVSFDMQTSFWLILSGGTMLVMAAYCCQQILPHR